MLSAECFSLAAGTDIPPLLDGLNDDRAACPDIADFLASRAS
jgi:hypothetical protein